MWWNKLLSSPGQSPIQRLLAWPLRGPYLGWRVGRLLLFGLLGGSLMVSSYFIYLQIYRTLADANSIVVLASSPELVSFDFESYQQTEAALETKEALRFLPPTLRNIFQYAPTTTTTSLPIAPRLLPPPRRSGAQPQR